MTAFNTFATMLRRATEERGYFLLDLIKSLTGRDAGIPGGETEDLPPLTIAQLRLLAVPNLTVHPRTLRDVCTFPDAVAGRVVETLCQLTSVVPLEGEHGVVVNTRIDVDPAAAGPGNMVVIPFRTLESMWRHVRVVLIDAGTEAAKHVPMVDAEPVQEFIQAYLI